MGRRGDHTKEEIKNMAIEAAERIVEQLGYPALSARKIAGEIGYTVGTLYLVFRNLDDLVTHVNSRTVDKLQVLLGGVASQNLDAKERALVFVQAYIQFAKDNTHLWRMVFDHRLPEGEEMPAWYLEKIMRALNLVEDIVRPALPGASAAEVPLAARAIWSGVHGVCMLASTRKLDKTGVDSVRGVASTLIENFIDGYNSRMLC